MASDSKMSLKAILNPVLEDSPLQRGMKDVVSEALTRMNEKEDEGGDEEGEIGRQTHSMDIVGPTDSNIASDVVDVDDSLTQISAAKEHASKEGANETLAIASKALRSTVKPSGFDFQMFNPTKIDEWATKGDSICRTLDPRAFAIPPLVVFPMHRNIAGGVHHTDTASNSFNTIDTVAGGFLQGDGTFNVTNNGVAGHILGNSPTNNVRRYDNPRDRRHQNPVHLTDHFGHIGRIEGGFIQGGGSFNVVNNGVAEVVEF